MGQILDGGATTTHAVRAAIQRSKAPLKELAARHGLHQKTVAKWRKRAFVHDARMGPKTDVGGAAHGVGNVCKGSKRVTLKDADQFRSLKRPLSDSSLVTKTIGEERAK